MTIITTLEPGKLTLRPFLELRRESGTRLAPSFDRHNVRLTLAPCPSLERGGVDSGGMGTIFLHVLSGGDGGMPW